MSLKLRLALTLVATFLAILGIGTMLMVVQARNSVANELGAARSVAGNRVAQLLASLPASTTPQIEVEAFVRGFNGDRHVRMMVLDATGAVRLSSQIAVGEAAMADWFLDLLAPRPRTMVMPLSGRAAPFVAAAVEIDPANEVSEVWIDFGIALATLTLFVLAGFVAVWVVADRALQPLGDLLSAFRNVAGDGAPVSVTPRGTPEMRALAEGFNAMVRRLESASAGNRRLSEHLLHLQDEERAELARDLHDDLGPLLFAIDVDASAARRIAARGEAAGLEERAAGIQANASKARQEIRRILGQLRPGLLPGLGLRAMLEEMAAALAERHRETRFELDVPEGLPCGALETLFFRAIREAVANALKHGRPGRIVIRVAVEGDRLSFSVTDDGGGLPETGTAGGFGLIGMGERFEAFGGTVDVRQVPLPPGVRVEGVVPCATGRAMQGTEGEMR